MVVFLYGNKAVYGRIPGFFCIELPFFRNPLHKKGIK